jgi:hypothetical protein
MIAVLVEAPEVAAVVGFVVLLLVEQAAKTSDAVATSANPLPNVPSFILGLLSALVTTLFRRIRQLRAATKGHGDFPRDESMLGNMK